MKTFLALSKWRLNRIVTLFEEIFQFFTFFEKIFHDQKWYMQKW